MCVLLVQRRGAGLLPEISDSIQTDEARAFRRKKTEESGGKAEDRRIPVIEIDLSGHLIAA